MSVQTVCAPILTFRASKFEFGPNFLGGDAYAFRLPPGISLLTWYYCHWEQPTMCIFIVFLSFWTSRNNFSTICSHNYWNYWNFLVKILKMACQSVLKNPHSWIWIGLFCNFRFQSEPQSWLSASSVATFAVEVTTASTNLAKWLPSLDGDKRLADTR